MCLHAGIDEISEDVYKGVDHSDTEDSEKSDSSDSEYLSDEEHKPKSSAQDEKDKADRKRPKASTNGENKEGVTGTGDRATPEPLLKEKQGSNGPDRDPQEKPRTPQTQPLTEKPKTPEEGRTTAATSVAEQDSDSERELVIDLGDEHGGRDAKRARREAGASVAKTLKESNVAKLEGEAFLIHPCFLMIFIWEEILYLYYNIFPVQVNNLHLLQQLHQYGKLPLT